jgi:phosphoribosylaminoimidazole-succinocarboxamide synthase
MSQGHYYQQEAGVSYQRIEKEEKQVLFCGIDITSWFYSSNPATEEVIHFTNNDEEEYDKVEQQPPEEIYQPGENEVAIQERNMKYWNIARIVMISFAIGIMLGFFIL